LVIDLGRALGWLPDEVYIDSPVATPAQLERFHDATYIEALQRAEATQQVDADIRRRHHIGAKGNPVHGKVFSRPATACGATLAAVALMQDGTAIVHSPAGGTHHGRPDRASGFCYLNDPVLGILALLDGGLDRVAYVDVDAHHCDGVEDAMAGEGRVLTVSIHERGRWPNSGGASYYDPSNGAGGAINLPVPAGFNDSGMDLLLDRVGPFPAPGGDSAVRRRRAARGPVEPLGAFESGDLGRGPRGAPTGAALAGPRRRWV
jgi:acetoin utilization protein AcuC